MGLDMFDIVFGFTQDHWSKLGYTPIFLLRLIEHGWTYDEVNHVLNSVIGPDYNAIKASVWLDRLEEQGVELLDEVPVIEILDRIMVVYLHQNGSVPGLTWDSPRSKIEV